MRQLHTLRSASSCGFSYGAFGASLRFASTDQRMAELETRLTKRLLAFWIAQAAATAGLVLGMVKLVGT